MRRTLDAVSACLLPGGVDLFRVLAQVDGYLYPHEAIFLYWLARDSPGDGTIVEVGSMRGRSALCMAMGLRKRGNGKIFAIDPHVYNTENELRGNIAHFGLDHHIEPIVAPSIESANQWKRPLDVVFLDGDHSRSAIKADVEAWVPHIKAGGFLVLHDSTDLSGHSGPRIVASNIRVSSSGFDELGTLGSITWARRAGAAPGSVPRQYGKPVFDTVISALRHQ